MNVGPNSFIPSYLQNLSFSNPNVKNGLPLNLNEVRAKAEQVFSLHEDKENFLTRLDEKLAEIEYESSISSKKPPHIYSDGESTPYYDFVNNSYEINNIIENFLEALPGVDVTPYQGSILKSF